VSQKKREKILQPIEKKRKTMNDGGKTANLSKKKRAAITMFRSQKKKRKKRKGGEGKRE